MVALEYNERIRIQAEQRVVMRLVKQTRAVDLRHCALRVRADVDQLERRAALNQVFNSGADSCGIGGGSYAVVSSPKGC